MMRTQQAGDSVDPAQAQLRMVGGGDGIVYSVRTDGTLLWYRHLGWQTGEYVWSPGSGRTIGSGWHMFDQVLAGAEGQLFGFTGDGSVWWHRYVLTDSDTGEGDWAPNTSSIIGSGFDAFAYVFGGWDNVIYAVDAEGDLYWFKYLADDGTNSPGAWANEGKGAKIATDRKSYLLQWADPGGVIYSSIQGGDLHWFRYLAGDGTNDAGAWANEGEPIPISSRWDWYFSVERFSNGGALYSVFIDGADPPGQDGDLNWYLLNNWQTVDTDQGPHWARDAGALVGNGWTTFRQGALQGYADNWSYTPGSELNFQVSCTFDQYQASVYRLEGPFTKGAAEDPRNATLVWGPNTFDGRLQDLPDGYRTQGCGWETDFSLTIPTDWASGYYTVKLTGQRNTSRFLSFVIRPSQPTAPIALLMPFLTYNAYNTWGGHNQYSSEELDHQRTVTMKRPWGKAYFRPPGAINAEMYGDLLLLRWLGDNQISYDCYQDLDLDSDDTWLNGYKAIILPTHAEYWTLTMRNNLQSYIDNGGRVISLGGNTMYERTEPSPDGTAMMHRDNTGNRWIWRQQNMPESDLLGVAFNEDPISYMTFGPYQVDTDHFLLNDTALTVGDQFGQTGYNLAASGWEVDIAPDPQPTGMTQIAHGTQDGGSNMVFWDKGDGWVFSVGSLCWIGSLATDPAVSKITLNTINHALQ
jgi:N,N-dimethylformamidase beta subunit-like protein/tachylectin